MSSNDPVANRLPGMGEQEPLLGRAGDASQQEGKPLYYNLWLGKLGCRNRLAES